MMPLAIKSEDQLSPGWTPKRRGPRKTVYCSQYCGFGCTWKAYKDAKARGAVLATRLGKGWAVAVWENAGWHYCATDSTGFLRVTEHNKRSYAASVMCEVRASGTIHTAGQTPEQAVVAALEEVAKACAMFIRLESALTVSCMYMRKPRKQKPRRQDV